MRGIIRDGLIIDPRGFDAIDDMDWRDWLRKHGAAESSVNAGFINGSYDLLFAFENGDVDNPRMAAGQALRGALRMFFTYRGALFWKMQAGMGDIVFAPFYEVLEKRGVKFRFFRRLENIALGDDGKHARTLTFSRQAEVIAKNGYQPLVEIKGVPSWPADPDLSQLETGVGAPADWDPESRWEMRAANGDEAPSEDWVVGEDFDFVVLAVGLGEVPEVAGQLLAASPEWKTMTEKVATVATQAFQIWLKEPVEELGWTAPPINISGYVEPFDTWADMRQLLIQEDVSDCKAIAYFCSFLPDTSIPSTGSPHMTARAKVRYNVIDFLNKDVGHFWPNAVEADADGAKRFRFELLAPGDKTGEAKVGAQRIDTQFWTANVNPTDRYVLSLPGTLKHRISPLDPKFANLTVAGDWTACSHMAGCVEAAVMSGQLAAHCISLSPKLEEIVGYDHP